MLQEFYGEKNSKVRSLNPFEVREVLQAVPASASASLASLNPFEVREVLQVFKSLWAWTRLVSIPLKSGRCCKLARCLLERCWRLNPFEVREVLQDINTAQESAAICLNPFEVREVLQGLGMIPVTNAARLNPFEVREVLQEHPIVPMPSRQKSQSLWSQGGAASHPLLKKVTSR